MDSIEKVRKLKAAFPVVQSKAEAISDYFGHAVYPRKTVLLRGGELSDSLYGISTGCLRSYIITEDGQDRTTQFFFEGQMVSSMQSFFMGVPSRRFLETVEDTEVFFLKKENFEKLMKFDFMTDKLIEFLKSRLFFFQELHESYLMDSPEQRYVRLLDEFPQLVARVPQYYIASYLGVTPVSLSRIRARLKKKPNLT